MTESSQPGMRGYGPFPEGAEPTAPIGAQPPTETSPPQAVSRPNPAVPHQVDPHQVDPHQALPRQASPYQATPEQAAPRQAAGNPATPDGPGAGRDPGPLPTGAPTSGNPYPGTPSGPPYGGSYPTSGGAGYGPFQAPDPFGERQEGWTETPYGFSAPAGRRIEPTPPPQRSRLVVGILAGLVAGLLLFGTGGYFAGRATAPKSEAAAPTPAPSGQLGVFEQNQIAINQPDFAGTGLTAISEGFLPYLSACSRPKANAGEKARVRCTLDGMSAIFVEYNSTADRDKARVKALGQAVDARTLTPGVAAATERATPSGRTTGNYLEYAYRLTESGTTRTVSGLWWDDAETAVAGYLLAYWKEGMGEKWDPMRDLWSRYA